MALSLLLGTASCGRYTAKKPLVTENVEIPKELTSIRTGNDYIPDQSSWDDWAEKAKDSETVVVKVKKISSKSYYWRDGKKAVGGITDTVVLLQSVIFGYIDEFSPLTVGKEFHIIEHYTVDKDKNILEPKYTLSGNPISTQEKFEYYINYDERTNPIMETGEEYIICMWNGWLLSEHGIYYSMECTVDGKSPIEIPGKYYVDGYVNYEIFEFSEAAYNASSAIVSAYTSKGEKREDNSYNLYHAMVKEAYERFMQS